MAAKAKLGVATSEVLYSNTHLNSSVRAEDLPCKLSMRHDVLPALSRMVDVVGLVIMMAIILTAQHIHDQGNL